MEQLRQDVDQFTSLDSEILVIAPDTLENAQRYFEQNPIPFTALVDETRMVYQLFDVQSKIISLDKQETKKVGILLNAKPRNININGLLAQNIPLVFMIKLKESEQTFTSEIYDGEIIINNKPQSDKKSEIIIDNEDLEFQKIDETKSSWLSQIFENDKTKKY